jgi:hypothetical protein
MANYGLTSSDSGVNYLYGEADVSAYCNAGQEINLTQAKGAFRDLEYESAEYIIGSVPIPGYSETEDVHVGR